MTDITDNNVVMLNPPTDKAASVDLTDDRLEAIAKDIESLTETATLQVGAKLAEARGIFRYRRDEGGFAGWVKTRLGYSRQTAYNFVHVHERFGGQVSKGLDTLSRSILYLLAAPSTPEAAREEVTELAGKGENLSTAEVNDIVREHKPTRVRARSHRQACEKLLATGAEHQAADDPAGALVHDQVPVRGITSPTPKKVDPATATIIKKAVMESGRTAEKLRAAEIKIAELKQQLATAHKALAKIDKMLSGLPQHMASNRGITKVQRIMVLIDTAKEQLAGRAS